LARTREVLCSVSYGKSEKVNTVSGQIMEIKHKSELAGEVQEFVRRGFSPQFGRLKEGFRTEAVWRRFREIGTDLWLDTGSIEDSEPLWTREFSALTTNNTLLNKEVQTGRYDSLICQAAEMLAAYPQMTEDERMLEMAFILNAWHGLRLVEKFDAFVSVEEHTDLAHDVGRAVECARRFHKICPERFFVKIPFTPAGLLATRLLSGEGVAVNHTLGFSARQNYVIARIGRPAYVNVFLGRLNSFVADNDLGDGSYIGEKATLASQTVIKHLREAQKTESVQIGASMRAGKQMQDLAGIDVMTVPPKVASELLSMNLTSEKIVDRTGMNYKAGFSVEEDPKAVRLDTLWEVNEQLAACMDALEEENLDSFTPDDLVSFFKSRGCGDVLVAWKHSHIATSAAEGKIPRLENWQDALSEKAIGLDSLMNLAGLNSFITDQKAMDQRVRDVLAAKGMIEAVKTGKITG